MGISIIYNNNKKNNNFINSNEIHKTCTLPTFSKSYLRQAVWGRYMHELIHLKTTLQVKFKTLQHQGKEVNTIIII